MIQIQILGILITNQLNDKLTTGLATGRSPYDIANDLQKRMEVVKKAIRSLVLTEYMNKLNEGQKLAYQEAGYKELRWHTSEDERVCSICGKLHDTIFDMDHVPNAPIHPRCRCTILPVVDVEDDESKINTSNFKEVFGDEVDEQFQNVIQNIKNENVKKAIIKVIPSIEFGKAQGNNNARDKVKLNDIAIYGDKAFNPFGLTLHEIEHKIDDHYSTDEKNHLLETINKETEAILLPNKHTGIKGLINNRKTVKSSIDDLSQLFYDDPHSFPLVFDILSSSKWFKDDYFNKVPIGHESFYWKHPGNIEREFFANYIGVYANEKEVQKMHEMFPESCKICDNIIKEYLRGYKNE